MTNITEEQLELFNENFRLKLIEEQTNIYDNYELTLDDLEANNLDQTGIDQSDSDFDISCKTYSIVTQSGDHLMTIDDISELNDFIENDMEDYL